MVKNSEAEQKDFAGIFFSNFATAVAELDIPRTTIQERLNFSKTHLSRLINGKYPNISIIKGQELAAFFGLDLPDFLLPNERFARMIRRNRRAILDRVN